MGDTGFMYAVSGKKDMGKLFENAVFLELKRMLMPQQEINYWKNKDGIETDFIIREGLKTKGIIQVAYDITDKKTKEREIRGLVACTKEYGSKEGLLITQNFESKETIEGVTITSVPLWKWLLRDK